MRGEKKREETQLYKRKKGDEGRKGRFGKKRRRRKKMPSDVIKDEKAREQ